MSTYRTGNHWGVTIVREGYADHDWQPFNVGETLCNHAGCRLGKADHTQLVAVVVNGDTALAERICALLNGDDCTRVDMHNCAGAWRDHGHADGRPGPPSMGADSPLPGCMCGHEGLAGPWHIRPCPIAEARFIWRSRAASGPADSCRCTKAGPDPACPVHQGRRARGPKPPPVGPGCICDGSGRTCPRHGAVI